MTPEERRELGRELFDDDHPNFALAEFNDGEQVPGSFTRSPVITDDVEGVRSIFTSTQDLLSNLERGADLIIRMDGQPTGTHYTAAEFEILGPTLQSVVLAKR